MADQSPIPSNVGEVRPAHRFDEARLAAWLRANLEGLKGPIEVRQFHGGASNPTFMVLAGDERLGLRKKPPGQLLASAHQVDREYRVMKALGGVGFPVPKMRALCTDESIIGTTFYVMDFLAGRAGRDLRRPERRARPVAPGRLRGDRAGRLRPAGQLLRPPDRPLDQAV